MNIVDRATETQLKNIQTRTGKTLDELHALVRKSGLSKHGEIRDLLKRDLGMRHGDANALAGAFLKSDGRTSAQVGDATTDGIVGTHYAGAKAELRPIYEKLSAGVAKLGPFGIAPKKGYVSLRRKKQFATVGPATKTRVDVGLNMKGIEATERFTESPAGGICQYRVSLTEVKEVDRELMGWIKHAYESAG